MTQKRTLQRNFPREWLICMWKIKPDYNKTPYKDLNEPNKVPRDDDNTVTTKRMTSAADS